ncbi:MAG: hypothetical protein KTR18_00410 [Acidiferrobacterales bacterium]|nr:hypothetical protein [Acidiferrobacterales bacterium]
MNQNNISIRFASRHAVIVALLVGLGGCIRFDHSLIEEPITPVRSLAERPCCDSLLEMKVETLGVKRYKTVLIDESDSVLEFRTGRSFAKAVELPRIEGEYLLQVDSVVNRPRIDFIPEALYPMVTLLDEKLDTVAIFDQQMVDLRRPILGPSLLRITLTIEEESSARYALIHTSPERTNQGISTFAPFELVQRKPFETLLYARPSNSRKKIHFAETGMVNLLAYPVSG